jgi:hypothetical protein
LVIVEGLRDQISKDRFAISKPVPASLARSCPEASSHVHCARVASFGQDDTSREAVRRPEASSIRSRRSLRQDDTRKMKNAQTLSS